MDLRVINPNGDEAVLAGGFTYFLVPPDTGIDSDGDGLTDGIESAGYEIAIDLFGFGIGNNGGNLVRRTVFSDPFDPDSDDDGLSDSAEFLLASDARSRDTDEDGLDDFEEVNRQLTSPVSVDTDGDARGPNGDLPPNARSSMARNLSNSSTPRTTCSTAERHPSLMTPMATASPTTMNSPTRSAAPWLPTCQS